MMKYTSRSTLEENVRSSPSTKCSSRIHTRASLNDEGNLSSSIIANRSSPNGELPPFKNLTNVNSNSLGSDGTKLSSTVAESVSDKGAWSGGQYSKSRTSINSAFDPNSPLFIPKGFCSYQPSSSIQRPSSSSSSVVSPATLGPSTSLYSNVVSLSSPYHQANRGPASPLLNSSTYQAIGFSGQSVFGVGSVLTASAASFQPSVGSGGLVVGSSAGGGSAPPAPEGIFNGNVRNAVAHQPVPYSDSSLSATGTQRSPAFPPEYNPRYTLGGISIVGNNSNDSSRRSSNIDSVASNCVQHAVNRRVYTSVNELSSVVLPQSHHEHSRIEADEEDDEGFDAFLNGALKEARGTFEEEEEEKNEGEKLTCIVNAYSDRKATLPNNSITSDSSISQMIVSLTTHDHYTESEGADSPNNSTQLVRNNQQQSVSHNSVHQGPRAIGTTSPIGAKPRTSCSRPTIPDCVDNMNDQSNLEDEHLKSLSLTDESPDPGAINEAIGVLGRSSGNVWVNHCHIGLQCESDSICQLHDTSITNAPTPLTFICKDNMLNPENDPVLVPQNGANNNPCIQGGVGVPIGASNTPCHDSDRGVGSVIGQLRPISQQLSMPSLDIHLDSKYTNQPPDTSLTQTNTSQSYTSSKFDKSPTSNSSFSSVVVTCSSGRNVINASPNDLPSLEDLVPSPTGTDSSKKVSHVSKEKSSSKKATRAAKPPPAIDDYPAVTTSVTSAPKKTINKWTSNIQTTLEPKFTGIVYGQTNTNPVGLDWGVRYPVKPSNKAEVLAYLKDYPETARHIKIIAYSYQHQDELKIVKTLWLENRIPSPVSDDFVAHYLFIHHKNKVELCMKYNTRGMFSGVVYGCCDTVARNKVTGGSPTAMNLSAKCRFKHRCLFCGKEDHGWFDEGLCTRYQTFQLELRKLGLSTELIGMLAIAFNRDI